MTHTTTQAQIQGNPINILFVLKRLSFPLVRICSLRTKVWTIPWLPAPSSPRAVVVIFAYTLVTLASRRRAMGISSTRCLQASVHRLTRIATTREALLPSRAVIVPFALTSPLAASIALTLIVSVTGLTELGRCVVHTHIRVEVAHIAVLTSRAIDILRTHTVSSLALVAPTLPVASTPRPDTEVDSSALIWLQGGLEASEVCTAVAIILAHTVSTFT